MIRKLLLVWLTIGVVLMLVGLAAGQVSYSEGPFGGQRFRAGPQGVQGGCYVGPGGQMQCGPGGCGVTSGGARTAPGSPFGSPFGFPSGQPSGFPGGQQRQSGQSQGGQYFQGGQCQGGQCYPPGSMTMPGRQMPGSQMNPSSGWRPPGTGPPPGPSRGVYPGRPVQQPQQPQQSRLTFPDKAVCLIRVELGNGERGIGSGTIVWADKHEDIAYVLTCAHIYAGATGPPVVIVDGKQYQAKMLDRDSEDISLLTIRCPPNVMIHPVAEEDARINETLWVGGFAYARRFVGREAPLLAWRSSSPTGPQNFMELRGSTESGVSGGPILNRRGLLVGVQWGSDGQVINGVRISYIHRRFPLLRKLIARRRARLREKAAAAIPKCPCPDGVCPVAPGGPIEPNSQAIKAALDALPPGTVVAGEPVYVPVTPESNAHIIASLHGIPIKGPIPDSPAASTPSPPVFPPLGSAVSIPAEPGPCAGLADLQIEIAELRKAIAALAAKQPTQPTAGPPGPPGNDGKIGPPGPPGPVSVPQAKPPEPWYLKGLDPETGREVVIPICPGDEVELLWPLDLQQVTIKKANK